MPPLKLPEAAPSLRPKQETSLAVADTCSAVGLIMRVLAESTQALLSVTTTCQVPGERPVAVERVWMGVVLQA